MNDDFLYQQIADSIRQEIKSGKLKPGDRVMSIRDLTQLWNCTPGTIQRAYQLLHQEGLVTSRPGQGTRVKTNMLHGKHDSFERAQLVNRVEKTLLEFIAAGYTPHQLDFAFKTAIERWKAIDQRPAETSENQLTFFGSHDPAVNWLAGEYALMYSPWSLVTNYIGSLGGLIALAQGKTMVTGSHLWDPETGEYNIPYLKKLLPGQAVIRLTIAERKLGLVLPPGNPMGIHTLADLAKPNIIFINRQVGSGTRVWLDEQFKVMKIDPKTITGYQNECLTHNEAARAVGQQEANAALALEAAAIAFNLDFIPLTLERYDLFFTKSCEDNLLLKALVDLVQAPSTRSGIDRFGGYDTKLTGELSVIDL